MANDRMFILTKMSTDQLSDKEFLAFYNAIVTKMDCSWQEWYPKVKNLYKNIVIMQSPTAREALDEVFKERFQKKV